MGHADVKPFTKKNEKLTKFSLNNVEVEWKVLVTAIYQAHFILEADR